MHHLGVLAYGSLLSDPGKALTGAIESIVGGVTTPFSVEYARSSRSRGGAPTLVPVEDGGGAVLADILVMKDGITLGETRDMVYRREIHQVGGAARYVHRDAPVSDRVWLPVLPDIGGIEIVVYTTLDVNIPSAQRTARRLAQLAVDSVRSAAPGQDGITYLEDNLARGIVTPLTDPYVRAVLELTGTTTFQEARRIAT